jgi:GNAT superfamily N-acetyltransferase
MRKSIDEAQSGGMSDGMSEETWTRPQLEGLLAEFLDRTLPAAEWTHHAHLRVGLMLGRRLPPCELHPALRENIAAYNVSTGNRNTDTTGYHDSITGFYAAVLGAFSRATLSLPVDEAARRLVQSPLADRAIVKRAYEPQTLTTVAARRAFAPWDHADFDPAALVGEVLGQGPVTIRLARMDDAPALRVLMHDAIGELLRPFLAPEQVEASREVMGLDTQLIADNTYYVVEQGGVGAGCGGWSRRATLFGGDHSAGRDAAMLDPASEPARVRAMYTRPGFTRRGVGRLVLDTCEAAARAEGFSACELAATMGGVPLYEACGYQPVEPFEAMTSVGVAIPLLRMRKTIS